MASAALTRSGQVKDLMTYETRMLLSVILGTRNQYWFGTLSSGVMRRRFWKYLAVTLPAVVMLGWLFLGVYKDREFGSHRLFIKHSPTLKFSFYAPLGESDYTLNDLDPERSQEEVMYRKYVEEGGGYKRSIPLGW